MIITRRSPLTGKVASVDLPITEEQAAELQRPNRRHIQDILPHLDASQREFVMTGYTQEDWNKMFPPEKEK